MKSLWYWLIDWLFPEPDHCLPNSKTFGFVGYASGDCECFCWDGVYSTTFVGYKDGKFNIIDKGFEIEDGRLYPGSMLTKMDIEDNRLYRFTVTATEIEDPYKFESDCDNCGGRVEAGGEGLAGFIGCRRCKSSLFVYGSDFLKTIRERWKRGERGRLGFKNKESQQS